MDEETGVVPFPPADRVQLALEGVKASKVEMKQEVLQMPKVSLRIML